MAKTRIGLIGLGFMGTTHYDIYSKMENAEVVAIADIDPVKRTGDISSVSGNIDNGAGGKKLDFSNTAVYENGFDLISQADVDIVDICVPTPWHADLVVAALKAGRNVMSEKPLARNLEQAAAIQAALKDAKGQLNIGMCVRAWPEYDYVYNHFKAGDYGKLRSAVLRRISPTVDAPEAHWNNWFMQGKLSGGALLDMHLHDTDFICHLLGRPKTVTSFGLNITSDSAIDQVITNYQYGDGTLVVAEGNWACAPNVPFEMSFQLICEKATIRMMPQDGFKVYWNDGTVETPKYEAGDGWTVELNYFVDCVRKGVKADKYQTFDSVLDAFKVVMAEQDSVDAGGKPVEVK